MAAVDRSPRRLPAVAAELHGGGASLPAGIACHLARVPQEHRTTILELLCTTSCFWRPTQVMTPTSEMACSSSRSRATSVPHTVSRVGGAGTRPRRGGRRVDDQTFLGFRGGGQAGRHGRDLWKQNQGVVSSVSSADHTSQAWPAGEDRKQAELGSHRPKKWS